MEANTEGLLLKGNYFGEPGYIEHDLRKGTMQNRAGVRMLALTDDFLLAFCNSLEGQMGDRALPVLKATGREWGRKAAEQFAAQMQQHFGKALLDLPMAMFSANLAQAFEHHGWGTFQFGFSRYDRGLLTVEVETPMLGASVRQGGQPVETLLAGFLSGMFSVFSGTELDCLQTDCFSCGADRSRFVITVPERLQPLAGHGRKNHADVLAALEQTRV
ncbi:MAG TPA: 4-vinyl reductase [Gemmataceae bacterium]|nr:4-vinyl reductase [Gemmataceae bacterium]